MPVVQNKAKCCIWCYCAWNTLHSVLDNRHRTMFRGVLLFSFVVSINYCSGRKYFRREKLDPGRFFEHVSSVVKSSLDVTCPVVVGSDVVSPEIDVILRNASKEFRAHFVYINSGVRPETSWKCDKFSDDSDDGESEEIEYDFEDDDTAEKKRPLSTWNCAVHLITGCSKNWEVIESTILGEGKLPYAIKYAKDYFAVWVRSVDPEFNASNTVFMGKTKYKVFVSGEDAVTKCFYCDEGAPKILPLPDITTFKLIETLFPDHDPNYQGRWIITPYLQEFDQRLCRKWGRVDGNFVLLCVLSNVMKFRWHLLDTKTLGVDEQATLSIADGAALFESGMIEFLQISLASWFFYDYFDMSSVYLYDDVCIISRTPKDALLWNIASMPYDLTLWGYIAASAIASAATVAFLVVYHDRRWNSVKKCVRRAKKIKSVMTTAFGKAISDVIRMLIEQSLESTPQNSSSRLLFAVWLFFGMIVATCYKTKLFSILTDPPKEAIPSSLEELVASSFVLEVDGYLFTAVKSFLVFEHPLEKAILNTAVPVENNDACLKKIHDSDTVCLGIKFMLAEFYSKMLDDRGRRTAILHCGNKFKVLNICMTMRRHHPMRDRFNKYIGTALCTGLFQKYEKDSANYEANQLYKKKGTNENDQVQVLTLSKTRGIFAVLFVGWALAFIAFFIEYLFPPLRAPFAFTP